jgi:hypothetical protein
MSSPPRQPPSTDIADRPRWLVDSVTLAASTPETKTNRPRPRPAARRNTATGAVAQDLPWRRLFNREPGPVPPVR